MQQHPLRPRIHIQILKSSLIFSLPFPLNIIQLSPKGQVNSGGYIYRDTKCRRIYLALFTNPERDLVVLILTKSVGWKIKKELFVNKRRHLGRICLHFNGQCFAIIFYDFVTNSVITDKPIRTHENLYPLIWWILVVDLFYEKKDVGHSWDWKG